jgi:hypothetical protein
VPVSAAEIEEYLLAVDELLSELDSLNAASIVRIRQEFTTLVDDIVAMLPRRVTLSNDMIIAMVNNLSQRIDDFAVSVSVAFGRTVSAQAEAQDRIFALLGRHVDELGGTLGIVGTSPELLHIASNLSLGLITGLTDELEALLRRELRLAALGARGRLVDASAAVNQALTGNNRWSARAERIVRTETLRYHSIETDLRMQEFARYGPINKMWAWSQISRKEHAAIHGQVRPHDGFFDVPLREGGVIQMRFPRDPSAAAHPSATINCGCYVIPLVPGVPSGSVST